MKSRSLKYLSDFQSIAESILTDVERADLLKNIHFFYAPDSEAYESVQEHSEYVDTILGFQINEIELTLKRAAQISRPDGDVSTWGRQMHDGSQSWVGLNPRQLLTPYHELLEMCRLLQPKAGSSMIDLGAGYARMAFVLNQYEPQASFIGYEIVEERVSESNRLLNHFKMSRSSMHTQDLSAKNFTLPVANYYLLYDYGNVEHIRATLETLKTIAFNHPIKVIGRGRMRGIIDNEHAWLSQVFPPLHGKTFSVYSSF